MLVATQSDTSCTLQDLLLATKHDCEMTRSYQATAYLLIFWDKVHDTRIVLQFYVYKFKERLCRSTGKQTVVEMLTKKKKKKMLTKVNFTNCQPCYTTVEEHTYDWLWANQSEEVV